MIRLQDITSPSAARQARDEFGAAWEHLLSAAEHSARQVGDASRRHGLTARERAIAAALALRGRQEQAPWRWLAIGLATGVVVGAVGAAVAGRRLPDIDQTRARAGAAVTAVRERVGEAAQTAATTARNTAGQVRDTAEQVRDRFGRSVAEQEGRLPEQATDHVPEHPTAPAR